MFEFVSAQKTSMSMSSASLTTVLNSVWKMKSIFWIRFKVPFWTTGSRQAIDRS